MKQAFQHVFPKTIPIFAGYIFLGCSYGILATSQGFSPILPILMSVIVYSGAMQFMAVNLLLAPFNPIATILITLMINARHLFYGIVMLRPYSTMKLKRFFVIWGLTDETFSINATMKIPNDINKEWAYLHVTMLNYAYWVLGTIIGATIGNNIPFNTDGIEFVLNALFLVLLIEQILASKQYYALLIGFASSLISLFIFGKQNFMVPAMLAMLTVFGLQYIIQQSKGEK